MAVLNKAALQAAMVAALPTNDSQQITAADLRGVLTDFIDSLLAIDNPIVQIVPGDVSYTGALLEDGDALLKSIGQSSLEPTTGWRDLPTEISVKGSGANNPSFTVFRDGISLHEFVGAGGGSAIRECWAEYHLNHDYKPNSDIYLHVHFAVGNTASSGNVKFNFEYTIAKGHQQGAGSVFSATTTTSAIVAVNAGSNYEHHVAEIAVPISSTKLEVDSVILCRIYRDHSDVQDTFAESVWLIFTDVHYQFDRSGTKNRLPNFYS